MSDMMTWDDAVVLMMAAALVLALVAVRIGHSMRRRRRHLRLLSDRLR